MKNKIPHFLITMIIILASLVGPPASMAQAPGASTPSNYFGVNTPENVNHAKEFSFIQSPTTPPSISIGSNRVTISPVRGINCFSAHPGCAGFYTKHYLWLAGTGRPEAVLITGTTCSGPSSGTCTVTFTAIGSHGAGYTLGTATAGYQEAYNDALLSAHNHSIGSLLGGTALGGMKVLGSHTDFPILQAPFSIDSTSGTVGPIIVDFQGSTLTCNTSGFDCITVGSHVGAEGNNAPNDVSLLNFQILAATSFVRTANGTSVAIHDGGQNTNIHYGSFGQNGSSGTNVFDTLILVDGDQNVDIGWIKLNVGNGPPMKCDSTWCGAAIIGSSLRSAANGRIHNSDLTIQCRGSDIDWKSGNGLEIDNLIMQNWAQFAWRYGAGLVDVTDGGHNYYEGGGGCVNPDFGVPGYSFGAIEYFGNHILLENNFSPSFPVQTQQFSSTGTNTYMYYIVGNKRGKQSVPLYIGYAKTNGSTHYNVLYKPFNADTYDVLRAGPTKGDGSDSAPYGTANWAVSTGNTCSSSHCTFAETFGATSSYSVNPAYVPADSDIGYWPVPVFMSNAGNSAGDLWIGHCEAIVNTSLLSGVNYYNAIFTGMGLNGGNQCAVNSNAQTGTRALFLNPSENSSNTGSAGTGAMILNPEQLNSLLTNKKGRINFTTLWNGRSHDTCLITSFDSNYAKTLNTWGHQPQLDSGDNCQGFDTGPTWTSWMAQSGFSWYLNHVFDSGTSSQMKLTTAGLELAAHLNQKATGDLAGSCTMSAGTSCTFSLTASYSLAPLCVVSPVTTTSSVVVAGACSVSGTKVTITAASQNSLTWNAILIGNPK